MTRKISIIAIIMMLTALASFGQTNRGGISGTVTDSKGAVIPGASVTIKNLGTGQEQTVITSEEGSFTLNSLDPVSYSVTVTASNFKKTAVPSVKVDTATTQTVNIVLEAGNIGEQVTIVADELSVSTESATTSQTISERELRDLPLNNRSVLDLAMTAPNVSGDAGSEDPEVTSGQPVPGFNISVNGGRPGSTNILADGVNNTGVGIARAVVSFTPETVQEFTVQTSAYSAEFGQTGGGVINATTKSGTNRLTGTALVYHRNPATNAQPYRIGTTPRTPNNLRYTNGSLTVGGPVFLPSLGEGGPTLYDGRNRTFFFVAYEPRWRQDFITTTTLIPTAAMMAGDFRNLVRTSSGWLPQAVATQFNQVSVGPADIYQQFTLSAANKLVPITLGTGQRYCQFGVTPGVTPNVTTNAAGQPVCAAAYVPNNALNVIPTAFIDPTAPKILAYMPAAEDYFLDGNVVRNKVVNRQVNQNETRWTIKLDHNITTANKMNFRYTVTPAVGVRNFGSDVNGSTGVYSDAKQFLLGDDHIFSPTMYNSLKLSYTRGVFSEDFAPEFSIYGGRNLATELGLPSLTPGGLPLFQISADGFSNAFADIGSSGSTNNFNVEERFSINDIFYWTRGNMTWKFGTELNQARLNVIPFFGASGGRWEFRQVNTSYDRSTNVARGGNPLASLLIGVPNAVQVRPLLVNYDYRWKGGALFVQNDWKVRPNLTLNLGLRYSLQLPRTEKNDLQGVFREDLAQTVTLTDAQRTAIATGLGITAASQPAIYAQIPTTVKIPVFAFAGRGGRSRYLVPVDKMGFEPRFGFAWSPKFLNWMSERSAVIRGGYGLSHAPITGNNRNPNPDFGAFQAVSTAANGSTVGGTPDPTQPVSLSRNAPLNVVEDLFVRLGVAPDGTITTNSIGIPGFVSPGEDSGSIPYTQNWNVSMQMELLKNTLVEVAYVGNKGTHLYMPLVNVNPANVAFTEALEGANLSAENTFADPLGRRNVANAVVSISRNSVATEYFGFGNFNRFFDPSANSIRHAAYVQVQRRIRRGLSFTANYTWAKSIDDSSDASPDVRVLTTGSTLGHVSYGTARSVDRSISTFDIKHNFNATFVWDIPVGKGRSLLKDAPGVVNAVLGGWTMSGVFRLQGGQPFIPFVTDTNRLNGVNRTVRLDLVEGVPLINPLYDPKCSIGSGCEPYINPSAFMRPAKGELGSAPRTLDVRAPLQEYFDLSFQKNFNLPFLGGEGRRYLQLRVDLLNAFNHPNFRFVNTGNTPPGFGTLPTETTLSLAEYNAYLTANGRANVLATDPTFTSIVNMINGQRTSTGAIPLDFYRIRIPEGFATKTPNAFDLTTLEGYKLYRLRQTYDANFGTLFAVNNPRYIQFGLKFVF